MICDFMPVSLVDYPGKIASTAFTSGCNFRCPYCHNSRLLNAEITADQDETFLNYLQERLHLIEGVCISGGEPTLHPQLPLYLQKIKALGLAVKLDTNGTNPTMLTQLIEQGCVDYIAMDIKAPLKKYHNYVKQELDISLIETAVNLLMEAPLSVEFRTTVVPSLLSLQDFMDIANWLKGAPLYVLQGYRYSEGVLDVKTCGTRNCDPHYLNNIKESIAPYFKTITIK